MSNSLPSPFISTPGPLPEPRKQPLVAYVTTAITVGHLGYGVVVDDAKCEARVIRSTRIEARTVAAFPFAEVGKEACVTAYKLDRLANDTEVSR